MAKELDTTLSIHSLSHRYRDFAPEAYEFVMEGLNFTVRQLKIVRHVSGMELLEGLKKYALAQFGPMTLTVLTNWKIRRCEDFGSIVFRLVEANILRKTEGDSLDDFKNGYDFEEAFVKPFKEI